MNKRIFGLICLSLICSSYSIRTRESWSLPLDLSDLSELIEEDDTTGPAEVNEADEITGSTELTETAQPIEADAMAGPAEINETIQPIEADWFNTSNPAKTMETAQKTASRKLN